VRSTFGQLGPGEKIKFVLRWNESSRHFVEPGLCTQPALQALVPLE
jgi:hypothetical protein